MTLVRSILVTLLCISLVFSAWSFGFRLMFDFVVWAATGAGAAHPYAAGVAFGLVATAIHLVLIRREVRSFFRWLMMEES